MTLYDDCRVRPDGWCTMTVIYSSKNKHQLNVLVMNNKQHSLLSLNTCIDLNLIKMNDSVHLVSEELLENIVMQYANVFQGIGCLHGEYKLEVDSTVTPVQVRPRNISLSLKDDVKAQIDTLEQQSMI